MKLQLTGFATISGSNKLPLDVKEKIINNGKKLYKRLIDSKGNEVILKGPLKISKTGGNLTARFAFSIKSFELVELDIPKLKETKEEKNNKLAQELISSL